MLMCRSPHYSVQRLNDRKKFQVIVGHVLKRSCPINPPAVVCQPNLASQATVHQMSSGTARLKRRLDEQGINYTNKRAVENFCLVRLSGTEVQQNECVNSHPSSRLALHCLPWRKRTRMNLFPYGSKMYARLIAFSYPLLRM
jgi:hypothetical protein